ncbi:hypothetical protein Tco_0939632 [Tanacetum coccineum]|uniref:MAK10-like protein n=1 Tax=Tanacetum coccineum TaxID=301880 RepID=A0ABQ5DN05_9ASTR
MGDANPIRTLGDYSKPSHEGYRNTIELLVGNNVDPSPHEGILLLVSLFPCSILSHREVPQNSTNDILMFRNNIIGPHDTQYCMEDPEQAFLEYASSRTGQARSDTVKNPKLSTSSVLYARSYPTKDPQFSTHIHGSINAITIHPKQQSDSHDDEPAKSGEEEKDSLENTNTNPSASPDPSVSFITEKVCKLNSFFESLDLAPQLSDTEFVCTKGDDGDVMFIEIVKKDNDSRKEEPEAGGLEVEYFDTFPTRSELAYHKYLMCGPIPSIFLRNPIITEGCPSNLKIPCNIGHVHMEKAYIDLNSPLNIMTRMMYN